jgi:hypothetical protein
LVRKDQKMGSPHHSWYYQTSILRATMLAVGIAGLNNASAPSDTTPPRASLEKQECGAADVRLGSFATDPIGANIVPRQEWSPKRT